MASDDFEDSLDGRSPVLRAVRNRDLEGLRRLLTAEAQAAETRGHMGRRPLHAAAEIGDAAAVRCLLEAGACVDAPRPQRGDTPLFWARSAEVAELLIRGGAAIHARDFAGREPIHWAAQFARPDVLAALIAHGADPERRDGDERTPLHWAAGATSFPGNVEITDPEALDCVRVLLQHHVNVNARDKEGRVPLHGVAVLPNMSQRLYDGSLKYPSPT